MVDALGRRLGAADRRAVRLAPVAGNHRHGVSGPLFDRAVEEGVLYVPGECCYPLLGHPRRNHMIRLSFGVPSCQAIRQGVEALGRAIRKVL